MIHTIYQAVTQSPTELGSVLLRPAKLSDVNSILKLVNNHAKQGLMLMKSPLDIYRNILSFVVCEIDSEVVGCSRLVVLWKDIGEVASLAVADGYKRHGIGRELVNACLQKASEIALPRVFALTYQEAFFKACGFHVVPRETLPHKVFGDCLNCPKADNCDETAVIIDLSQG